MTPAELAALRQVPVHDDKPGTLSSHIKRLERAWRETNEKTERDRRVAREVRAVFAEARRR